MFLIAMRPEIPDAWVLQVPIGARTSEKLAPTE